MIELVNTSLPNGLIAGTHGFATVAMTKGVPDALRGRLETLCAYAHRTSAHDAAYYLQNPVNWFHVTLPQGEHVVGRVAPSDFDYTGRTNRLARLRAFGAAEMPRVGGAEVLVKAKDWFSQPWRGEPRYLDEDKNACERLRGLDPTRLPAAPSWESLFGSEGLRWARQVAWQVEKNLSAGGKTVYFKTSPSWDVSGEKLLGLFADVINLLPVDARSRVTFSTYPVSLPGGTVCHLRGVHDRDRLFAAASETQAWVDCENARIANAEMLPTSDSSRKTVVAGGRAAAQGASVPFRGCPEASRLGVRRPVATGGASRSYGSLVAPRQKGPDMFIVTLVAVGAAVLLAAGVLFSWMIWQNRRQMENSGAAAAVEAEIKNLESEKEQRDLLAKKAEREAAEKAEREAAERKAREDAAAQERAAREAQDEREAERTKRDLEKEKAKKDAEAEAAAALEKAKKDAETAFVTAHVEGMGTPPKPKVGSASTSDEPESFRVFYYSDGGVTLTNEVAGFKPRRDPVNRKKVLDYSLYVRESKCKLEPIERSPVVLWLSKGRVWFDWGQRMAKREPWFAESDSHDLQKDCFGSSETVFDTWSKAFAVTYLVSWGEEKGQSVEWKERGFKLGDAVDVVYKSELESLKKAIADAKKKIDDNEEKIKNVKEGVQGLNDEVARYDSATNTLHQLKSQQESLKKQLKEDGLKGDEKKRLQKARDEKGKEIERQKGKVNEIGIDDIERQLKDKKNELDSLEKFAQSLATEHEAAQQAYKQALEDPNREGRVRECSFSVVVKGAS